MSMVHEVLSQLIQSDTSIQCDTPEERADLLRDLAALGVNIHAGADRSAYLGPPYDGTEFMYVRLEHLPRNRFGIVCSAFSNRSISPDEFRAMIDDCDFAAFDGDIAELFGGVS